MGRIHRTTSAKFRRGGPKAQRSLQSRATGSAARCPRHCRRRTSTLSPVQRPDGEDGSHSRRLAAKAVSASGEAFGESLLTSATNWRTQSPRDSSWVPRSGEARSARGETWSWRIATRSRLRWRSAGSVGARFRRGVLCARRCCCCCSALCSLLRRSAEAPPPQLAPRRATCPARACLRRRDGSDIPGLLGEPTREGEVSRCFPSLSLAKAFSASSAFGSSSSAIHPLSSQLSHPPSSQLPTAMALSAASKVLIGAGSLRFLLVASSAGAGPGWRLPRPRFLATCCDSCHASSTIRRLPLPINNIGRNDALREGIKGLSCSEYSASGVPCPRVCRGLSPQRWRLLQSSSRSPRSAWLRHSARAEAQRAGAASSCLRDSTRQGVQGRLCRAAAQALSGENKEKRREFFRCLDDFHHPAEERAG